MSAIIVRFDIIIIDYGRYKNYKVFVIDRNYFNEEIYILFTN